MVMTDSCDRGGRRNKNTPPQRFQRLRIPDDFSPTATDCPIVVCTDERMYVHCGDESPCDDDYLSHVIVSTTCSCNILHDRLARGPKRESSEHIILIYYYVSHMILLSIERKIELFGKMIIMLYSRAPTVR